MKALTVRQPHAEMLANGSKRFETRGKKTNYRGIIAIHAGLYHDQSELIRAGSSWNISEALGHRMASSPWLSESLTFGAVIGIAYLTDCKRVEDLTFGELDKRRHRIGDWAHYGGFTERQLGHYASGRYAYRYEFPRKLLAPIPYAGMPGMFEWREPENLEELLEPASTCASPVFYED